MKIMNKVIWLTLHSILLFSANNAQSSSIPVGKLLTFERSKGNCLACHAIDDGEMTGNIGPPLANMKIRFSSRKELKKQIWDATIRNPKTSMPPFGRNKILSEEEIEHIVEYLWTL
jgi:sulfur-oxidizing protein SoxX